MNIYTYLFTKIQQALIAAGISANFKAQLRYSSQAYFGHYQVNGIMTIAKDLGIPPRILAEKVVRLLDLKDIAKKIDIAGPGFINIFLDTSWLEKKFLKHYVPHV